MTDREPDDLYDALRDRLADYGQEPPAPLWANIRAQLPPPVAVPQRRRRRPVGRLALLLVLLSAVTWGGWQLAHRSKPAPTFVAAGAAGAPAPLVGRAARQRAVADQVATGAVVGWLTTAPAAASPADASAGRASGRAHLPATVVASVASGPATAAAAPWPRPLRQSPRPAPRQLQAALRATCWQQSRTRNVAATRLPACVRPPAGQVGGTSPARQPKRIGLRRPLHEQRRQLSHPMPPAPHRQPWPPGLPTARATAAPMLRRIPK